MGYKLQQIRQSIVTTLNFLQKHKFIRTKRQQSTEEQPLIYHLYEDNYSETEDNYSDKSYTVAEENLIHL